MNPLLIINATACLGCAAACCEYALHQRDVLGRLKQPYITDVLSPIIAAAFAGFWFAAFILNLMEL